MSTKSIYSKLLISSLTLVIASLSFFVGGVDTVKAQDTDCYVKNSASSADNAVIGIGDCNSKKIKVYDRVIEIGDESGVDTSNIIEAIDTSYVTGAFGSFIYFFGDLVGGQDSILLSDASGAGGSGANSAAKAELLVAILNNQENNGAGLNGAVTALNRTVLRQRPLSGTKFIEEKVYALTHPGQVQAQDAYYRGTGFDLLKPVQSFWGWSVNIVYGLLIFIIIGVAFAIMFRDQIGDGVAVSIQTAIPNIALAMLLVPLSYAISGLIVDGMTLGLNVTQQFLIGPGAPAREVYEARETEFPCSILRQEGAVLDSTDTCEADGSLGADDVRVSWLYASANLNYTDEVFGFTEQLPIVLGINETLEQLIGWMAGGISAIVNLIIGIILLLTGLRIFWALFNKFILFVMGPIFAPFFFAAIAIPGQGISAAMQYIKLLTSAALYYIVAYGMTLLSLIFSSSVFQTKISGLGFSAVTPPLLAFENILAGSGGTQVPTEFINFYTALISLGIYLMIPKTLKNIDAALGTESALPSFITDAWDSAKESVNLGRQGLNIGRTYGGRAVRAPGSGIRSVQRRVFGIDDNDYRSLSNVVGRNVNRAVSRLDARAQRSNSLVGRAAFGAARGIVRQGGGRLATTAAGGSDAAKQNIMGNEQEGKKGSLEISFQWNGGANEILVDDKLITELSNNITPLPIATSVIPGASKLIIKAANGAVLPPDINDRTAVIRSAGNEGAVSGSVDFRNNLQASLGASRNPADIVRDLLGEFNPSASPNDDWVIRPLAPLFQFNAPGFADPIAFLRFNDSAVHNYSESGGQVCEIKLDFFLNPALARLSNENNVVEGFMNAIAPRFVQSNMVVMRVSGFESNPLKIRFNTQFVNSGNRVRFNNTSTIG